MIVAERLTKRFGSFTAIEDVSFSVERGEIIGFLGPNGAGKSTTMRILAGVFPPTAGRAVVAGYDIVRESLRARAVVGYFPERVSLYMEMAVDRYLLYVAQMKGLDRRFASAAIAEALAACGLEPVASRVIGTLSKGYRQRVGIAQALVGSPEVLILDEPTSGLDPEQVSEMRALIRGLRGQRTVILSTHILSEVEATCDRVIIINRGRVLAVDTPTNLNRQLRRTSQVYVEVAGSRSEVMGVLRSVPGILDVQPGPSPGDASPGDGATSMIVTAEPDRDIREDLAARVVGAGLALRELRPVILSLEEIFLSLVANREPPAMETHEVPGHLPT